MNRRASAVTLAAAMGLAGLGAGAVLGSGVAGAAATTTKTVKDRATAIKDALAGLVKDGTINQDQADKVASTLDKALPHGGPPVGFGGPGGGSGRGPLEAGLSETATALGMTQQDLRTALESGKTLTQIAQDKGISRADLVSKLVTLTKAKIAAAVKAGRLTQSQADMVTGQLQSRISELVDRVHPGKALGGFGGFGPGGRHGHGPGEWARPGSPASPTEPAPAATPSASPATLTS